MMLMTLADLFVEPLIKYYIFPEQKTNLTTYVQVYFFLQLWSLNPKKNVHFLLKDFHFNEKVQGKEIRYLHHRICCRFSPPLLLSGRNCSSHFPSFRSHHSMAFWIHSHIHIPISIDLHFQGISQSIPLRNSILSSCALFCVLGLAHNHSTDLSHRLSRGSNSASHIYRIMALWFWKVFMPFLARK